MKEFLNVVSVKLQTGVENDDGEIIGQGAIVTFSEEATVRINLQGSRIAGAFADAVDSLPDPLAGGRTKTDLGLNLADTEVAQTSAGYREDDDDVKRMLIVITDGGQSKGGRYVPVSQAILPFFERDMEVFAVGVGLQDADQEARKEISSMVQISQNAIFPDSYSDLINQVNDFVRRFCPGTVICTVYYHNTTITYKLERNQAS
jgi:hypothetical protein